TRIDLTSGTLSPVAGVPGTPGFLGDGGDAQSALLDSPAGLALHRLNGAARTLFVADRGNHRVRSVDLLDGTITTVTGDGVPLTAGEGAPASVFSIDSPTGLSIDAFGNLAIAGASSVRLVTADGAAGPSGQGQALLLYGRAPRDAFPESVTGCLTGIEFAADGASLHLTDQCTGYLIRVERQ
ncbi:MAG: hypothetical protein AAFY60_11845, partial [Myxococcota bacterium]